MGKVVMRISATDIDDGDNGTVQYRFGENNPRSPEDLDFFEIEQANGEIKLKKSVIVSISIAFKWQCVALCVFISKRF